MAFEGLLPQANIRVWEAVAPVAQILPDNHWRRQSAQLIREAFLASLQPDAVLVTSLFEGYVDDSVTSVKCLSADYVTAAILHDLIPYIHPECCLENSNHKSWYFEKIKHLRRISICLSVSDWTRRQGMTHLNLASDRCVNIAADADKYFGKVLISDERQRALREKYGLERPFIMYNSNCEPRKNNEGLIRAYARLSPQLRASHQLVVVCALDTANRVRLEQFARDQGLKAGELILTGYVPDADLLFLYNLCHLFVSPSWSEGLGLPVLEAMRCGAAVIGADNSCLPEIIGLPEALFDPYSDEAIAQAMTRALSDDRWRQRLIENARIKATNFSWDKSARRAIEAMEKAVSERTAKRLAITSVQSRPKLAYVSPLPPERTGIANYSAELLPALASHYEIEVIVAQDAVADPWINDNCSVCTTRWFRENVGQYDRVLYHFGNSVCHQHMFDLLQVAPGIVVLHDFYLSDLLRYMQTSGYEPGVFDHVLFDTHGWQALYKRHKGVTDVAEFPCSLAVIEASIGIISHSQYSLDLAKKFYNLPSTKGWEVVPLLRKANTTGSKRLQARKNLGLTADAFVVCSFGFINAVKSSDRLLRAWLNSELAKTPNCHLIFVGENQQNDYV